jgi:hypothetical protein
MYVSPGKSEAQCEKGMKMSHQLQIEEKADYLAVEFTGTGAVKEVWQEFESIAERCRRANKNKLLLSVTEYHGEVSVADRYNIGDKAEIFAYYKVIKVAIAAKPERIDPQRFGEKVARNRWVNIRVFADIKDAVEWLVK